jgi:hypothetical protein
MGTLPSITYKKVPTKLSNKERKVINNNDILTIQYPLCFQHVQTFTSILNSKEGSTLEDHTWNVQDMTSFRLTIFPEFTYLNSKRAQWSKKDVLAYKVSEQAAQVNLWSVFFKKR